MRRNWIGVAVALSLVGLVPGCGSDPGGSMGVGNGDPAVEQMADVALESDLLTAEMLRLEADAAGTAMAATTDDGGPSGIVTEERTFRRTQPCPLGGQMTVEGSMVREFDRATRVMVIESDGSRTRADCAFPRGEMIVTINSLDAFEEFRRRLEGQPDGLQTSRYHGSIDVVRSDGEEHFCEYDYTIVRDPETQTRTIDGTFCGGRVRKGVPWRPHP